MSNKKKNVIAQNSEKIANIGFDSLTVKDSFSFITASLDKLASMTKFDNTDEKITRKWVLRDNWQRVIFDIVVEMISLKQKSV